MFRTCRSKCVEGEERSGTARSKLLRRREIARAAKTFGRAILNGSRGGGTWFRTDRSKWGVARYMMLKTREKNPLVDSAVFFA